MIMDARLKDLNPTMPVIFIKAIPVDKQEQEQECVPMSRLQDSSKGAHIHVDFQPEDQRESH